MALAAAAFSITIGPLVKPVIDKLRSTLTDVTIFAWELESKIKKLIEVMETMGEHVMVAEDLGTRTEETWKQKVMDIIYDVDDLSDDIKRCAYSSLTWVKFYKPITDIEKRIADVRKDIESYYNGLRKEISKELGEKWTASTNSRILKEQFVGRRDELDEIVKLLTSKDDTQNSISIVGMGGLGKSELAKMVWADERVKKRFGVMKWAHVSFKNYDAEKVVAGFLSGSTVGFSLQTMLDKLEEDLRGKTCLFILDDIWDMNQGEWDELLVQLPKIKNGNKVLITTSYQQIADLAVKTIRLKPLSPDDCLRILEKSAEIKLDANPHLSSYATEIIKKCEGVPLAVVTLASKLRNKTEEKEWSKVADSVEWSLHPPKDGNIMFRLKLSYDNLIPSYKSCFAYHTMCMCNDRIDRERLKHMWSAQGFTKQTEEEQAAFKELQNASFFPEANQSTFRVMSLFRDLTFLVANEYTCMSNSDTIGHLLQNRPNTRHIHVSGSADEELKKFKKLRTIVGPHEIKPLSNFPRLRVLDSCNSNLPGLCKKVGKLNHLRYLEVSGNRELKELPISIGKLINLETLRVNKCYLLKELPDEIKKLVNLKHLYISSQQAKLNLKGFRLLQTVELESCGNLRILNLVDLPKLEDLKLKGFRLLRTLDLESCKNNLISLNLVNLPELQNLNLEGFRLLQTVELERCRNLRILSLGSLQTLELESCQNLKNLSIVDLPALGTLRHELADSQEKLTSLCLSKCGSMMEIPEWFKKLTSLQRLDIDECCYLTERCKLGSEDWSKINHAKEIYLNKERIKPGPGEVSGNGDEMNPGFWGFISKTIDCFRGIF